MAWHRPDQVRSSRVSVDIFRRNCNSLRRILCVASRYCPNREDNKNVSVVAPEGVSLTYTTLPAIHP